MSILEYTAVIQNENTIGDLIEIVGDIGRKHDRDILILSETSQEVQDIDTNIRLESRCRFIEYQ